MELIERAMKFSREAHKDQRRKISGQPYFTHVNNVAKILKDAGFTSNVVAAGYLHDVIEDTKVTKEDLQTLFGEEVVELILHNTENKDLIWEDRKRETIIKAANASYETKALIAADKLDNSRDLILYYHDHGDKIWDFFNRGFDKQSWYYLSLVEAIFNGIDDEKIPHFFIELKNNVDELFVHELKSK